MISLSDKKSVLRNPIKVISGQDQTMKTWDVRKDAYAAILVAFSYFNVAYIYFFFLQSYCTRVYGA